ncbi:MAG: HD domain-containing protein [Candidatus Sumerlaeaceae bacterium]|nr:HD domain-containing protein [Candidatus Sumerlaeaceae bacterium]
MKQQSDLTSRIALISRVSALVVGTAPFHVQMQEAAEHLRDAFAADAAILRELRDGQLHLLACSGVEPSRLMPSMSPHSGIAQYLLTQQQPLCINNASTHAITTSWDCSQGSSQFRFEAYAGAPMLVRNQAVGVLGVYAVNSGRTFKQTDLEYLQIVANHVGTSILNARLYRELSDAYEQTIEGWAIALEIRDPVTHGHTRRVAEQTVALARALGLAEGEIVHIRRGALLHDIGKMAVPDSILSKPGPLCDEEREIMRQHTLRACEMLAGVEFLEPALAIPRAHHERWDGSGYPAGLKGEEIPLAARIFAVVDVWDALTSDRPYRSAISPAKAAEYLRENRGVLFDPDVVDAFLPMVEPAQQLANAP